MPVMGRVVVVMKMESSRSHRVNILRTRKWKLQAVRPAAYQFGRKSHTITGTVQVVSDNKRYLWNVGLVLLVWTAFGVFFGTQSYLRDAYSGKTPSLPGYIVSWTICGYTWGLLTYPVLAFVRRF